MFTGKQLCWSIFLIKLQGFRPAALLKKNTPTQVFSSEYYEIFKNISFEKRVNGCFCKTLHCFYDAIFEFQINVWLSTLKNAEILEEILTCMKSEPVSLPHSCYLTFYTIAKLLGTCSSVVIAGLNSF